MNMLRHVGFELGHTLFGEIPGNISATSVVSIIFPQLGLQFVWFSLVRKIRKLLQLNLVTKSVPESTQFSLARFFCANFTLCCLYL